MSLLSIMFETFEANNSSEIKIKELQYKRLKNIVNYAKNNSLYFKDLYVNVGDDFKLEELPTTNKLEMMDNFDNWLTDNNINMKKLKNLLVI